MKKIKEYLFAVLIGLTILFINNLPIIFGFATQYPEFRYLGKREINSVDMYTYLSFIEQSKQGRFLFENLYQSEPQTPSLVRPSYVVIGKFAALFNQSALSAYHLSRIFLTIVFMIVLYSALKLFFQETKKRLYAFALILASSGIGYILALLNVTTNSTDLWIPESITFLSLAEAPHFILSQIFMLAGAVFFIKGLNSQKYRFFAISGFFLIPLSLEHPFNVFVVVLAAVTTSTWLFVIQAGKNNKPKLHGRSSLITGTLTVAATGAICLLYQVYETVKNPILKSWAAQSPLNSPEPIYYLTGYGLILVFAVFGLQKALGEKTPSKIYLCSWIFSTAILIYAPIFFQRRFTEGLHIPLAILATLGIFQTTEIVTKNVNRQTRKAYTNIILISLLLLISLPLLRVFVDINAISRDNLNSYTNHLLIQEIAGMNWLKDNSSFQDIVLTNSFYGNLLPGISGRKVLIGHPVQSPYFAQKSKNIETLLVIKDNAKEEAFLKENRVTFMYFGVSDIMLNVGYDPSKKPYLTNVFKDRGVLIFKVN